MVCAFHNVPRRIRAHFGAIWAHKCPKNQNFQKIKNQPPGFCPNFRKTLKTKKSNGLRLPQCAPEGVGLILGLFGPISAPNIKIFKK